MNPVGIIPTLGIFLLVVASAPPKSLYSSVSCDNADSSDERAICSHDRLTQLDKAIAMAMKDDSKNQNKHTPADNFDYPRERRSCGANAACILDTEVREVSRLDREGGRIPVPTWVGSYRLSLLREGAARFVNFLPVDIGTCTKTKIVGMEMRSGDATKTPRADANFRMSVEYDDWGFQVSFGYLDDLAASTPGDDVVLCLDAVPQTCLWNEHVKIYSATNLRTQGSWILTDPDAKHVCEKSS
jgi:uncharacterized protein